MKALSARQAGRCENATTARCVCRCGGAFHGTQRVANKVNIPPDDPHASASWTPEEQRRWPRWTADQQAEYLRCAKAGR